MGPFVVMAYAPISLPHQRTRAVSSDNSNKSNYKPNWQFYVKDSKKSVLAPSSTADIGIRQGLLPEAAKPACLPLPSSEPLSLQAPATLSTVTDCGQPVLPSEAVFKPLSDTKDREKKTTAEDSQLATASAEESLSIVFGAIGIPYTPEAKPSITPSSKKISPRRTAWLEFSCNICGHRMGRNVNPRVLVEGTTLIECENCNRVHKIVDNLNWL